MSMKSLVALALAAAALPASAHAQTILNINSVFNSSADGSNAQQVTFGPGTYSLSFVSPTMTQAATFFAFNRFSTNGDVSGCDAAGMNCGTGYENSFKYVINGTTYGLGDDNGDAEGGPVGPGQGYYSSAALSFANSSRYTGTFTLSAPTDVRFYIYDGYVDDNSGGVSVSVAAVPEPATWAMMMLGFGMIGFGLRVRRQLAQVSIG